MNCSLRPKSADSVRVLVTDILGGQMFRDGVRVTDEKETTTDEKITA